jgi:hypothetical protein
MVRRSPRHKERCLLIGKRSKWSIVRHCHKVTVGDASARVYGETAMAVCRGDAQRCVPVLGMNHANGIDAGTRVDVEQGVIVGRW